MGGYNIQVRVKGKNTIDEGSIMKRYGGYRL